MERFIYVVGEEARDRLVNMGYRLLREDKAKHIYVFLKTIKNFRVRTFNLQCLTL